MDFVTSDRLAGIGEYYFSQKLREIDQLNQQGINIISLGIGSPDMPPHPDVLKVLSETSAKPNVHAYQSYKGSQVLRQAICQWYKHWYGTELNPDTEVLPLIGSKEGIMHICMAYLNAGDRVLLPNPGYPTYKSAVKLAGGVCVDYELNADQNGEPDWGFLENCGEVKLMFVNYPHMPTGQLPSRHLFEKLVNWAVRKKVLLIHDNPYSFILNDNPMSLLSVPDAMEVALELNSLSKSHNMAGWRIGVLCGAKNRIDEVIRFKSNMDSGMFLPVQLAAAKALSLGTQWFQELNAVYARRRQIVFRLLDLLGCGYKKNQAGLFVWAKVPQTYADGYALSDDVLYNARVFITPGGIFGTAGNNYVRVSLCCNEEKMEESIQRVSDFLEKEF